MPDEDEWEGTEMDLSGFDALRVDPSIPLPPDLYEKPVIARGTKGLNDPPAKPCGKNYLRRHDMDWTTRKCRKCGATLDQLQRSHGFWIVTDEEGYAVSVTRDEEKGDA